MEGSGLVIYAIDENEILLVYIFYYSYIGIEKGDSFYLLSLDGQIIQNVTKILDINNERILR